MMARMSNQSDRLRAYLLATLAVGMTGMLAELLLIGHRETLQQQIPLGLLALGVTASAWHARAPSVATSGLFTARCRCSSNTHALMRTPVGSAMNTVTHDPFHHSGPLCGSKREL